MAKTYVCDVCDSRMSDGYTVAWAKKLTDSPAGIHFNHGRQELRNVCPDCWPEEGEMGELTSLLKRVSGVSSDG